VHEHTYMEDLQLVYFIASHTFDCPVTLSFAKNIRAIEPKGRKRSWRSVSLVSSDRFVTRIVAVSSATF